MTRGKVLPCVLCERKFSKQEVEKGFYHMPTMVCGYCYAAMQRKPQRVNCFGKPTIVQLDGKRLLGYSRKAEECQEYCQDRFACAAVLGLDR